MMDGEKPCTKCGVVKPFSEFYKRLDSSDGYRSHCKSCTKSSEASYRSDNQDRRQLKNREWYEANKDRQAEYHKAWYLDNRQEKLAANASWLADNHEQKRAKDREWRSAGGQKKSTKRWRDANRDRFLQNARNKVARRRARQLAATVIIFTADQLAARWAYYGNRCWICRAEATATDHVKPLSGGGAHMLCNLRPICLPCNSAKGNNWPYQVVSNDLAAAI